MVSKETIEEALKGIIDPELMIDIFTLGLIYGVDVEESKVSIRMTFTSMMCPAGPQLVDEVKTEVGKLEGVDEVDVEVVFNPPWEPSDDLKSLLGLA